MSSTQRIARWEDIDVSKVIKEVSSIIGEIRAEQKQAVADVRETLGGLPVFVDRLIRLVIGLASDNERNLMKFTGLRLLCCRARRRRQKQLRLSRRSFRPTQEALLGA